MPIILNKIIGFKSTIAFFSWDLLVKLQQRSLPQISRMAFVVHHKRRIIRSHYFFRFLENLFFRYPSFFFFKNPINKQLGLNLSTSRKRKRLYISSLSFVRSEIEMYIFAYFTLLFLRRTNARIYNTSHFGPDFVSLFLKDLTSYNVLFFHDFSQDEDWKENARSRFFINRSLRRNKKFQYFSLFKIFFKSN